MLSWLLYSLRQVLALAFSVSLSVAQGGLRLQSVEDSRVLSKRPAHPCVRMGLRQAMQGWRVRQEADSVVPAFGV